MWEFDPAEHQMLRELFDTTHKDVWKVLFKVGEVPPPTTEDRGLNAKRHANSVSILHFTRCAFVGVLGTGVPRLAYLRPAAWLKWGASAAQLHQLKLKTLARGQAARGGRQEASS